MKANFIIGKKQIILSALVVVLGGVVYLNFVYGDQGLPVTETVLSTDASDTQEAEETLNYGEATLVNGVTTTEESYFETASLSKELSRDEAIETVQMVLDNVDIDDESMAQATAKIIELSEQIESEEKIESLIKAKGFTDCIVYLDAESANVVVESDGLTAEQAAQIKNIVLSVQTVALDQISITEVANS